MSSSILTNPSALTALQALRNTQRALNDTQQQISTGLKIASAADNASTWSIAESMKSQEGVLTTISDALNVGSSTLNSASASLTSALSVMNSIKQALAQTINPGGDVNAILTNVQQLGQQLKSIVASATISGLNIFDGSATSVDFLASYTSGNGTNAPTLGKISFTTTALTNNSAGILDGAKATSSAAATDFTALTSTDLTSAKISDTLANADKAIADLTTYAAKIGATQSRITLQSNFVGALKDALKSAVSSMVDADMNEASTRLQALQTQQQLGVQALSIANQNAQAILKLFQ